MTTKCNIDNSEFDEVEWMRITDICRKKKHIGQDEIVKDIIEADDKILEQHGITYEQLGKYFDKIMKHYDNNEKTKINSIEASIVNELLRGIDIGGWCLWSCMKSKIFNERITVIKLTWGGAETCPFQDAKDTKYHGYEYGSSDWIFIKGNECMHIGDLLFHQIVNHHFFQSPQSRYHVDVNKLIEFFGIRKDVDYTTTFMNGKKIKYKNSISEEEFLKIDTKNMRHETHDVNEFYYDDTNMIIIANNKDTIPHKIGECIYEGQIPNVLIAQFERMFGKPENKKQIETYEICDIKVLTQDELSRDW